MNHLSTQEWLERTRGGGYIPPVVCEGLGRSPRRVLPSQLPSPTRMLREMVVYPLDRPDLVKGFVEGAGDFGRRLAPVLREEGLEVAIVPRELLPSQVILPGGLRLIEAGKRSQNVSLDHAGGFYQAAGRRVVLQEKYLRKTNITIHEIAHAADHLLSEKCAFGERLSTILWYGFKESRKLLASGYMLHGPHEYFAVSLEIYYKPGGRKKLGRIDPELLRFLDSFLA